MKNKAFIITGIIVLIISIFGIIYSLINPNVSNLDLYLISSIIGVVVGLFFLIIGDDNDFGDPDGGDPLEVTSTQWISTMNTINTINTINLLN